MKNLSLILFLLISTVSYCQVTQVNLSEISKTEFLVGTKAQVITIQNKELVKPLMENVKLILENRELIHYVDSIYDSLLMWTFELPPLNSLVGKDKVLYFDDGSRTKNFVKISIYSQKPELSEYIPNFLFQDVTEAQNIKFTFKEASYVDKIEFIDKRIQIEGTFTNSISSSSLGFNANNIDNSISIKVFPNECEEFDVVFYYINTDYQSTKSDTIKLRISKEKKYLHERFKIIPNSEFYVDDFESLKYKPIIIFDFEGLGIPGQQYTIEVIDNINITTLAGGQDFKMPDDRKVQVEISNVKISGIYNVKITNRSNETFESTLNILPKPEISEFTIPNNNNNKIEKIIGKTYSIKIYGDALHKMSDVKIELVNIVSSESINLIKQLSIIENTINSQVKFDFSHVDDLPIGDYYLRLTRELKGKENTVKRVYPYYNSLITIIYPYEIVAKQVNQVSLVNPEYFKDDSLHKRYESLAGKLLRKDSKIILRIDPCNENELQGPQFLKINAKYTKSNGNEVLLDLTEGGNDYLTVLNKPIFIDLKKEFNIDELKVNEKVTVVLSHSPEKYGSNKLSPVNVLEYHRGVSFSDKVGITLSIPPYLAAFRYVKRKTITEDENGQIDVNYDGDKEIEFQSLTINAGIGFKYRNKNKFYEPSRFALGLYMMGLDFANNSSIEEQKTDPDNYSFIARGSFNLLFLAEYSFLNLDNPNTRIPVYFGIAYILDPIDGGSNFAPVFGFGIDIKLFGSN